MAEYLLPFALATLIVVIVIQAVERYMHGEQAQREQSKLIAAVLSKDMAEYTHALKAEKEPVETGVKDVDEVPLSEASDDVFDKFIKDQVS